MHPSTLWGAPCNAGLASARTAANIGSALLPATQSMQSLAVAGASSMRTPRVAAGTSAGAAGAVTGIGSLTGAIAGTPWSGMTGKHVALSPQGVQHCKERHCHVHCFVACMGSVSCCGTLP